MQGNCGKGKQSRQQAEAREGLFTESFSFIASVRTMKSIGIVSANELPVDPKPIAREIWEREQKE